MGVEMKAAILRIQKWLGDGTEYRRVVALFAVALLFYAFLMLAMMATDFGATIVHDVSDEAVQTHPDIPFYQERTEGILAGQIPYLDFYSESPPLIMYLMLPAALMGNTVASYAVLFTAYVFITAFVIYILLRKKDEAVALLATGFFLFNPITWATAIIFVQDETVVALFYALPVLLLILGRAQGATLVATLGALTKIFSAVLVPLALIKQSAADMKRSIIYLAVAGAAVTLPLLLVAWERFLRFPSYYLRQTGEEGLQEGISVWVVLYDSGITFPGFLLQALFVLGTLYCLYLIWKRDIDSVRGAFLLILPFFLFFPKIYACYFIIPLAVICILATADMRQGWLLTVAAFLSFFVQFFQSYNGAPSMLPSDGLWSLIPFALALSWQMIMLYMGIRMLRMGEVPLFRSPDGR